MFHSNVPLSGQDMNSAIKVDKQEALTDNFEGGETEVEPVTPYLTTDQNRLNTEQDMNTERRMITAPGNSEEKVVIVSFNQKIRQEAQLRLRLEDLVNINQRFSTLFLGLKLNTMHNSAVLQPLMFLIRRIVFAAAIIFLQHSPQLAIVMLLAMSLAVLVFTVVETPWKEQEMN